MAFDSEIEAIVGVMIKTGSEYVPIPLLPGFTCVTLATKRTPKVHSQGNGDSRREVGAACRGMDKC